MEEVSSFPIRAFQGAVAVLFNIDAEDKANSIGISNPIILPRRPTKDEVRKHAAIQAWVDYLSDLAVCAKGLREEVSEEVSLQNDSFVTKLLLKKEDTDASKKVNQLGNLILDSLFVNEPVDIASKLKQFKILFDTKRLEQVSEIETTYFGRKGATKKIIDQDVILPLISMGEKKLSQYDFTVSGGIHEQCSFSISEINGSRESQEDKIVLGKVGAALFNNKNDVTNKLNQLFEETNKVAKRSNSGAAVAITAVRYQMDTKKYELLTASCGDVKNYLLTINPEDGSVDLMALNRAHTASDPIDAGLLLHEGHSISKRDGGVWRLGAAGRGFALMRGIGDFSVSGEAYRNHSITEHTVEAPKNDSKLRFIISGCDGAIADCFTKNDLKNILEKDLKILVKANKNIVENTEKIRGHNIAEVIQNAASQVSLEGSKNSIHDNQSVVVSELTDGLVMGVADGHSGKKAAEILQKQAEKIFRLQVPKSARPFIHSERSPLKNMCALISQMNPSQASGVALSAMAKLFTSFDMKNYVSSISFDKPETWGCIEKVLNYIRMENTRRMANNPEVLKEKENLRKNNSEFEKLLKIQARIPRNVSNSELNNLIVKHNRIISRIEKISAPFLIRFPKKTKQLTFYQALSDINKISRLKDQKKKKDRGNQLLLKVLFHVEARQSYSQENKVWGMIMSEIITKIDLVADKNKTEIISHYNSSANLIADLTYALQLKKDERKELKWWNVIEKFRAKKEISVLESMLVKKIDETREDYDPQEVLSSFYKISSDMLKTGLQEKISPPSVSSEESIVPVAPKPKSSLEPKPTPLSDDEEPGDTLPNYEIPKRRPLPSNG